MSAKELAVQVLSSTKVATAVPIATAAAGFGTATEIIPVIVGIITCMFGSVLSYILIRYWSVNLKKVQLELRMLKEKDLRAKENARLRELKGEVVRRDDD